MRFSRLRSAGAFRVIIPALVVLLSVAGYVVTKSAIDNDRETAAERSAQVESARAQTLLGRARAYVFSLGAVLATERSPAQRRFFQLAGSTAGGVGLGDALWVQRVPREDRASYERRVAPITRPTRSGRLEPAPPAAAYLPASATSRTRAGLRPGVDVSYWPALAAAIRDRASVFAVGASAVGKLGDKRGFYLVQAGRFGRGPNSRGFLVVFVPRGWLTASLEDDPRHLAIRLDGRLLDGRLDDAPAASTSFDALARPWRIDVTAAAPSSLQSMLPWLALGWPIAAALLVLVVATSILRRRRAERYVERIFDFSLDLLSVSDFDGFLVQVNPAFEQALGFSRRELLSRPFTAFVHPDDVARSEAETASLIDGRTTIGFENRWLCKDGSYRWFQWKATPVPERRLVYGMGRDVTERRQAEAEQAALRRVATLVARRASPGEIFSAVTEEIGLLSGADVARMERYERDGTVVGLARWGRDREQQLAVGTRFALEGPSIAALVKDKGGPVRVDSFLEASGPIAEEARAVGIRSSVGGPIVVEGRLWGVIAASSKGELPFPADTESQIAEFTELVATAIANAESRSELAASRARIVAAADETRRRIERDLHDGTQQRLLSVALSLRATEARVPPELDEVREELAATAKALTDAVDELIEISRGIHPAILRKGGLKAALGALARRSAVPVELTIDVDGELPERVEVGLYYVVSEALTNVAKHSRASAVQVRVDISNSTVDLVVRDDGIGGADPRGSGLIGLRDRVEALGGTLELTSNPGEGTELRARVSA